MQEPYTIFLNDNKYVYNYADSIIYRDGQYYPATFKVLQNQSILNNKITGDIFEELPFQQFTIDAYVSDMTIFYYIVAHDINASECIIKCYCDDVLERTITFGGGNYLYPIASFNINKYVHTFKTTIAINKASDNSVLTGFAWIFYWAC